MVSWRIEMLATPTMPGGASGGLRALDGLGVALAQRGHEVRLLCDPARPTPAALAGTLRAVRVPPGASRPRPLARTSTTGRNASDLIDPEADVVVAIDGAAGTLEWDAPSSDRTALVLLLRERSLVPSEGSDGAPEGRDVRRRLGAWLNRRALRRIEAEALAQARLALVESERTRSLVERRAAGAARRVRLLPTGAADPVDAGTREAAREALGIPKDVRAIAYLGEGGPLLPGSCALDAFRRIRPIFPGARLLVPGEGGRRVPGVMLLGTTDEQARALTACDLAFVAGDSDDPAADALGAMRYNVATVLPREFLPEGLPHDRAARTYAASDGAEAAGAIAELLAVSEERRAVAEAGRAFAETRTFARMAERFESLVAPVLHH
jgi:hypothetical protein